MVKERQQVKNVMKEIHLHEIPLSVVGGFQELSLTAILNSADVSPFFLIKC